MKIVSAESSAIISGVMGSLVLLYGQIHDSSPELYYVIGSSLLLITSLYFKLFFFIAFELIMIAGHGTTLLGIGPYLQIALPVLLCFQLFIFCLISGQWDHGFLVVGLLGIVMLSIGFAHHNQWIYFFGGLSVSIYSFYSAYQGKIACYLWAIVNGLFAILALYNLLI